MMSKDSDRWPSPEAQQMICSWINDQFETADPQPLAQPPSFEDCAVWTCGPDSGVTGVACLVGDSIYYAAQVGPTSIGWWTMGTVPVEVKAGSYESRTEGDSRLSQALRTIDNWLKPPSNNEGANFLVSRLTDPVTSGSMFGGGDISLYTVGKGSRGILSSQGAWAYLLPFGNPTGSQVSLTADLDLQPGRLKLEWTPSAGQPVGISVQLSYGHQNPPPAGPSYFFVGQGDDQAEYTVSVVLL